MESWGNLKKRWIIVVCLFAIMLGLQACGQSDAKTKEIVDRGFLRVGIKVDVPNFGYINPETQVLEGLEIDLARLIAEDLLGNREAVELIPVTAQTRGTMLDNGELDLVIATFTITEERKEIFHFTDSYFHDEIGFLVRKDSMVESILDIDGKPVGLVQSGTATAALTQEAEALGITFTPQEFASYPEIKAALLVGEIIALCVDKSILYGYADEETMILADGFNPQDYGIATKLENVEFGNYLDKWLESIRADGTLDELLIRWGQQPLG